MISSIYKAYICYILLHGFTFHAKVPKIAMSEQLIEIDAKIIKLYFQQK